MRGVRSSVFRQRLITAGIVALALYFGVAASARHGAIQRKGSRRPQVQLTVITGADKGLVRIRSTRFFCSLCANHAIEALKTQRGVQQVTVKDDVKPVTVHVHFDPNVTNARIIAAVAKRALEKEATDNAVIRVVFEKDQG